MIYVEFRNTLITQIKNDLSRSLTAGEKAKDDKEIGIYLGRVQYCREMLNYIYDVYVVPDVCSKCGKEFGFVSEENKYIVLCKECVVITCAECGDDMRPWCSACYAKMRVGDNDLAREVQAL